ncbi:ATP-binding protein [Neorhizobium galegae]|uniref:ATP-binding protein n=1 Tax=Neorhizobium galegae TaxID=399 RepID=UPI0021016C4F|nr:ATP-binding protein [Neorhizobium galegae]MCQ1572741.1 ATP-binding protein [Neorhizobium galegae]
MRASENPIRQAALARLLSFIPPEVLAASDRMKEIRSKFVDTARDKELALRVLKLKTSFDGPVDGKEGSILIITGESHAGKTTMLERTLLVDPGLQEYKVDGMPIKPLVFMEVKAPSSLQSLAVDLLKMLGYPVKVDMKRPAAFRLLLEKLQERQVLILWLDEAQNLLQNNPVELGILANNLVTIEQNPEWPIRIILSGLPDLDMLVDNYKQIRSRADHWPLGRTTSPEHVATWLHKIVEEHATLALDDTLYYYNEDEEKWVDNEDFALRLIHASDGNFGTILRLIRDAVECGLKDHDAAVAEGTAPPSCRIGRDNFAKAYSNIVGVLNQANIFYVPHWGDLPGGMARVKLEEMRAASQQEPPSQQQDEEKAGKKVKPLRAGERRK